MYLALHELVSLEEVVLDDLATAPTSHLLPLCPVTDQPFVSQGPLSQLLQNIVYIVHKTSYRC